jgi:hypothetical protein
MFSYTNINLENKFNENFDTEYNKE